MTLEEAASWALAHFYHADRANAVMHCAPVRFSPITFRLAEALADEGTDDLNAVPGTSELIREILSHKGTYQEDSGR